MTVGPMSIVPNTNGKFIDGYLHYSFPLLMLSNFFILFMKGAMLSLTLEMFFLHHRPTSVHQQVCLMCLLFLPNLLFSLILLTASLGIKTALALAARYPGCLLMPVFTFWTFGPNKNSASCISCLNHCNNGRQVNSLYHFSSNPTCFHCKIHVYSLSTIHHFYFFYIEIRLKYSCQNFIGT